MLRWFLLHGIDERTGRRVHKHQIGAHPDGYTYSRRPVELVWSEVVETYQEASQWEHQIKGWSRAKKEALIHGDIEAIHKIVKSERRKKEQAKRNSRTERKG